MVKNVLTTAERTALLIEILHNNTCYNSFINMLKKKRKYKNIKNSMIILSNYVLTNTNSGLIHNAGTWAVTKEGFNFWLGIEQKIIAAMSKKLPEINRCRSIW